MVDRRATVLHAGNPASGEYTLCGVAWDCNHLDMLAGEADVEFACAGQVIDCPECRKVIAYCKSIKGWKEPSHEDGEK